MAYTIHAQDDRLVDVSIDDGEGLVIRKKMDLQPYGYDIVVTVPHPEKEGEFIQQVQTRKSDPFDDLAGFFSRYIQAYKQGKQKEEEDKVPQLPLNEEFFHSPQVNSEEAAAE